MLVVLDADVVIAGTLAKSGACHDIVDAWLEGEFEVALCPHLLDEIEQSLKHPRIAGRYGLDAGDIESWIQRLKGEATVRPDPIDPPRRVPDDSDDDYLVALAEAAGASALVSRDQHLTRANPPRGVEILTPGDFQRRLTNA